MTRSNFQLIEDGKVNPCEVTGGDYEIIGEGMQMLAVELDHEETVIAEAGAMNWMEEGIEFEAKLGDGADPTKVSSARCSPLEFVW